MLSFLFLFACMRFMLFVRVKSSCKKKERGLKLPRYPHLVYYSQEVYFSKKTNNPVSFNNAKVVTCSSQKPLGLVLDQQ